MSEEVDLDIYTPVCLAQTSDTDTFYGKNAWVYGWGTTASGGSASATLLEVFRIYFFLFREWGTFIMCIRWASPWWPLTSAQWPWGPGRRDRSVPGERRARTAARWAGSASDIYLDNLSSGWQRRTSDIRGWWPAHSHRRCQLWIRMCRGMAWDCEKVFNVCILGGIVWCVRTNFLLQNLDWGKDDKPKILSLWCNRWCLSWLYSIVLTINLCFWHEEIFKWPLRHCFQYFVPLEKFC